VVVGKSLVLIGLVAVVVGLLLMYAPSTLSWFGRLPGDIHYERGGTKLFIPITSMLLVSVVLSLVGSLLLRK
jgi:hypothetical protein